MVLLHKKTDRPVFPGQLACQPAAAVRPNGKQLEGQLKQVGADAYDLWTPETHALRYIVTPHEEILGAVYGRYHQANGDQTGHGVLVATNLRLLLIDKKPLYVRCDVLGYDVLTGVNYARSAFAGTVSVHTKLGDIRFRTYNKHAAKTFVEATLARIFEGKAGGSYD
jgi:hypothetical protein